MTRTEQGAQEFRLPDVGEGLVDAEILRWYVRPGDRVEVNQPICEIETAKAAVELPSPYAGTVLEVLVEAGTTVDVGTPIIRVGDGAAGAATGSDESTSGQSGEEDEPREKPLVGSGEKPAATQRRRRRPAPTRTEAPPREEGRDGGAASAGREASAASNGGPARPLAKPPVRKLARDLGVDLREVTPTGAGGVVTREDVQRHTAPPAAVPKAAGAGETEPQPRPAGDLADREERIPVTGVQRHMASAMVDSAFTAPHVTEFLQVDATKALRAVRRLRERPEFTDVRVSPLLLVAKALLTAVKRHPRINATWDDENREIVVKHYVNLGIAAATDRGLIVPNIKDADSKPLPDLARELNELTETAREGTTTPAAMSGGTITVTNVGVFGVDAGTPIINPGEGAILAFGQIRDLPWVHKGKLAVRKVTTLSLSFDHRMIDGELGSKVLRDVGAMLEDPEMTALAWG
ncbi:dihydrolipoamide acetyltransferase family protein [Halostreptopolyspora alba]|uniref:Dihydrolipoamide acetyltransferase component of pyruvate dehydrogenase complex n=1 Tax=Halostreptopolyspora alba TaxID=2487137 RepID=A0A3N0E935_9ACTN|nr:2-oxo acid dehydrogenase subunit E2 [Nocardiopsaceae bacterium YIM 96095]